MSWSDIKINEIINNQRKFFKTGKTLDISWRIEQLKRLKKMVIEHEIEIEEALAQDLGRTPQEAYLCDIGSVILECNEAIRGIRKWAKPEKHLSGLVCFPSVFTKVYKMPYGVSLIISPFNFPFLLSLGVLINSIAGGNTAVIKASSKSKASTALLKQLISKTFPPEYAIVIDGGHEVADLCLKQRFDKIFYTGSPAVAKHIMTEASKNLTPVTLELGGETGNWCVIRKDADLKDAARKVAFMKICNSGQICININQVAVAEEVADRFVNELKQAIVKQIGEKPYLNPEYPKLINKRAYEKCADEVDKHKEKVVFGGEGDPQTCKYSTTILYPVEIDDEVVNHELFCPILPVVTFKDCEINKLMETISEREHGLALYVFTKNMKWANEVMSTQQYGGGCINEVCLHLMVKGVPFNGTGHSGMGAYHGEWGFREFTHPSTVLKGSAKFNLPLREHPYTEKKSKYKMPALKIFEK